jgi:putative SOS response-associated peptidase YedK
MYTWQELVALYRLSTLSWSNLEPRYNVCPTDTIDVVLRGGDEPALVPMRWGLIPSWWKKPVKEMKVATFNARSESVAEKPMFAESFARRRCLIPLSGYYEWLTTPDGQAALLFYATRRTDHHRRWHPRRLARPEQQGAAVVVFDGDHGSEQLHGGHP